jgi:Ca-activated chloride channel homolog
MFKITHKTLRFGIYGALGALLLSSVGEPLIHLLPKANETVQQADIVFVVDATGSMQDEINGVKNGITDFASQFGKENIDLQVGTVWFRDRFENPDAIGKLKFEGKDLTKDYSAFSNEVNKILANGGGDDPESAFDAIDLASHLSFRENALRILILITDAPPKDPDYSGKGTKEIQNILMSQRIFQLHIAVTNAFISSFAPIQEVAKGELFSLEEIGRGDSGFEKAMPKIGAKIAEGISGIASNEQYSPEARFQVIFVFTVWWGFVSLGISALLIHAQNRYLKKKFQMRKLLRGGIVGLLLGLVVGVFPQLLFLSISSSLIRILAWTLIGGGIGWTVSRIVPNYRWIHAIIGGMLGGFIGGASFVLLSFLFPDFMARLLGVALVGFFIGIMISLLEEMLREIWLTVKWNDKESSIVSLGERPILLGSSVEADIYLPKEKNFPPVTGILRIDQGRIIFENKVNGTNTELKPGNTIQLGTISIIVSTAPAFNKN